MEEATVDAASPALSRAAQQTEFAKAKVNLALHVPGRRADGYHLLDSLVVFAEIGDTLTALPNEEGGTGLIVEGRFGRDLESATAAGGNLVLAVANGLREAFPIPRTSGVMLHLEKRLPVASGLGGGSADAAAALRLLDRLWHLELSADVLAGIGLSLGADVPVCLASRPSRMRGIGEELDAVSGIPPMPMVLVNPGVTVATGNVFRRLDASERPGLPPLPEPGHGLMEFVFWLRRTRNDLFEPAMAEAPPVKTAARALAADPDCALARMSGSGATVFGIFMSMDAAERAAARIRKAQPDWWVVVTRTAGS